MDTEEKSDASNPHLVKTSVQNATPPALHARSTFKQCLIVLIATSSMIINIANTTTMSIALPTIEKEWNLEPAQLQWAVSAYSLSTGCFYLVCGRCADVYGRKNTFCVGSLATAVFTLACGFAPNILALDILRGIQGVGASAIIPASIGILAQSFPPSRARSLAFATFAAGAPIGAVFGTAVGGALTEFTAKSWRSSFYLLSGFTILCLFGGLVSFDKDIPSQEADKRIDWLGAFLITAGLVFIVFVLGDGEIAPKKWRTPYIIAFIILGVLLIGAFIYWQDYLEKVQADPGAPYSKFTPPPLMKPSLWKRADGKFAAMMAVAFTTWCSFMSWTFWVQLYYQNYKHYAPMLVVVRLLPMFVSGIACNIFVGLMASRVPVVYLVSIGGFATALSCLLFAVIDPNTTYWAFGLPASVLTVLGADFVFSAGTLFISRIALPHEQSVAGALFSTMTQIGTAVGITVTTVVFNTVSGRLRPGEDDIVTYHAAQWTGFAFGIIAAVIGVIFFRGVGVVGVTANNRTLSKPASRDDEESGTTDSSTGTDTKKMEGKNESHSDVLEVKEMGA